MYTLHFPLSRSQRRIKLQMSRHSVAAMPTLCYFWPGGPQSEHSGGARIPTPPPCNSSGRQEGGRNKWKYTTAGS